MAHTADDVVAVGVAYRDHLLTLRCPGCATRHDVRLPAVMMVATPSCPTCGHTDRLEPDAIAAACDRLLPSLDRAGADRVNARVTAIVTAWPAHPAVAGALVHDGVDLAVTGALDLLPLVLEDVLRDDAERA